MGNTVRDQPALPWSRRSVGPRASPAAHHSSTTLLGLLPLQRNRSARQPHYPPGVLPWLVLPRMVALRNLLLHPLHQKCQLLRFLISFRLLAHLLQILRSIRNTIRHRISPFYDRYQRYKFSEGIAYPIGPILASPTQKPTIHCHFG